MQTLSGILFVCQFRLLKLCPATAYTMQSYTVPLMLSPQYAGWRAKIGLLFGGFTLLFWIPCYFMFPEVSCFYSSSRPSRIQLRQQCKDRTYQELDELYASGVPVRHFAKTKTNANLERDQRNLQGVA